MVSRVLEFVEFQISAGNCVFIVFIFFVFVWGGMLLQQLVPIKSTWNVKYTPQTQTTKAAVSWSLASFGACEGSEGPAWRIIPFRKWLITMVSKSPKWGYSPSKWPKWLINRGY